MNLNKNGPVTDEMKVLFCAICGPTAYRVLYPERIDREHINFAARKTPGKNHFRFVECSECGLIYSTPIFKDERMVNLYIKSEFIEEVQIKNMQEDYLQQLKKLDGIIKKDDFLEIGCANGFFLKKAQEFGFKNVVGVEPGKDAVAKALLETKDCIINDIYKEDMFENETFDVVAFFQVLDHMLDPSAFLQEVYNILRPGGVVLAINHNVRFIGTRVAGEKSPMFDIEHICLFDPSKMRKILSKVGFDILYVKNITNSYSIEYVLKMLPLPSFMRELFLAAVHKMKLSQKRLRFKAGNMVSVARKV